LPGFAIRIEIFKPEGNSLIEIDGIDYRQTIYCYVEEKKKVLEEFISRYNESSIIHMVTSVVESCEKRLLYCLCDIITNYIEMDKEPDKDIWFVTDIKGLYNIVKRLYSFIFEKIIYLEQDNVKEFDEELEIDEFIKYFLNIQWGISSSLMKRLWYLRYSNRVNDYVKFLHDLQVSGVEKEKPLAGIWCCLCEILSYEFEHKDFMKDCIDYKLSVYSVLMLLGKKAEYTNMYLETTLDGNGVKADNLYFVWNQFKRISFKNLAVFDKKSRLLCDKIYEKCYSEFEKELNSYFIKIPLEERNKNLVVISTIQFVSETHAPTRTVIERAKTLKKLGKDVIIINTAEQYLREGYLPFYCAYEGTVLDEYNGVSEFDTGYGKILFIQIPANTSIPDRMQLMVKIINNTKPYYILSIGTGSILADLCGNIVPCASMALVFSTLPKTKNKMKILGRNLYKEEKKLYIEDDIIESRFTFELKPQKGIFSRESKELPEDRFILVVIGIRLEFEVTDAFMDMLEEVCSQGCYVVFAGIMDNYNKLMESYPVVSANSSFIGYCNDMLALMDICDLYVNPERLGGGFSIIEAFVKGKPGVYLKSGDVYTAGGESFAVDSFKEMAEQILKYKEDKDYYNSMSGLARERAKLMTSSEEAIADIDRQICERVESKYW